MKLFIAACLLAVSLAQTGCEDNVWSEKDCNTIFKDDMCYMANYYENCQKGCECHKGYDHEADRAARGMVEYTGLHDSYCVNNDKFVDSQGFDCTTYEGAGWCKVEDGKTVQGDGWCPRRPQAEMHSNWCDVMPGRKRMEDIEYYANTDGDSGLKCCCNNLPEDDYPYSRGFDNGGECDDMLMKDSKTVWHDRRGWTCKVYYYGDLCNLDGTRGSGWNNAEWGQHHDWVMSGEKDAGSSCCACGGGHQEAYWDALSDSLLRKISKYMNKEPSSQNWNRVKKNVDKLIDNCDDANCNPAELELLNNMDTITQDGYSEENWALLEAEWEALVELIQSDITQCPDGCNWLE